MITLYTENAITDLKRLYVNVPKDFFSNFTYDIDLQNSNVTPLNIQKWSDVKGKYVFIVKDKELIATYNKDKFDYNPDGIKVSSIVDYECYQLINNKGSILNTRNSRKANRSDFIDTTKDDVSFLNRVPISTRYLYKKDWDPSVNRDYYIMKLEQYKLVRYSLLLDNAYDLCQTLSEYRKREQTRGKKLVYTDWYKKVVDQVYKVEMILDAIDKNTNPDLIKLKKELTKLNKIMETVEQLFSTEDHALNTFGKIYGQPLERPHAKIVK